MMMVFLTHVCEDKYENGKFEHLITDTSVSPLGLINTLCWPKSSANKSD